MYAPGYLRRSPGPRAAGIFAAYDLLLASLAAVVLAANLLLFLVAWEAMTLLSWFLVVSDRDEPAVRQAGQLYLAMSHLAGAALILAMVQLAPAAGPWDFGAGARVISAAAAPVYLLLLLLLGFGTKAAIVPLHVWLPEAHAAAPSHVSALMSGVLITLGLYGLLRFLPMAGSPPLWLAAALMLLGMLGACGGALMALSQRDVKRVLAYSTVENAGILTLALGAGVLGNVTAQPVLAAFAWSAFFVHLWSHAAMKSLLFYGFGALAHVAGSRDLEEWGGAVRRWPRLGFGLVVGGGALGGLPGTTGFLGEWLLFMALFQGCLGTPGAPRILCLLGIPALALASAMALACFVRLLGIGLLGRPRSAWPPRGHAGTLAAGLAAPVLALAAVGIAGPWLAPQLVRAFAPAIAQLAPSADPASLRTAEASIRPLAGVSFAAALALAAAAALLAVDRRRRRRRVMEPWGCAHGFAAPRAQYTATSLAQPVTSVLQPVLKTSVERAGPTGLWPRAARWAARTPERAILELYRPALQQVHRALSKLAGMQRASVTGNLRYLALVLVGLIAAQFLSQGIRR